MNKSLSQNHLNGKDRLGKLLSEENSIHSLLYWWTIVVGSIGAGRGAWQVR